MHSLFYSMKKVIVWLLTILFSAQVMAIAPVAGAYSITKKVHHLNAEGKAAHFPVEKMAVCGIFDCDPDEAKARCAIEEMSDFVVISLARDDARLRKPETLSLEPKFTSIDLPRVIPPPRA